MYKNISGVRKPNRSKNLAKVWKTKFLFVGAFVCTNEYKNKTVAEPRLSFQHNWLIFYGLSIIILLEVSVNWFIEDFYKLTQPTAYLHTNYTNEMYDEIFF